MERWSELMCSDVSPVLWRCSDCVHVRKRFVVCRCFDRLDLLGVGVLSRLGVGSSEVWGLLVVPSIVVACISLERRPLLWPRGLLLVGVTLGSATVEVVEVVRFVGGGVVRTRLTCFSRWRGVVPGIRDVSRIHSGSVGFGRRWWRRRYEGLAYPLNGL